MPTDLDALLAPVCSYRAPCRRRVPVVLRRPVAARGLRLPAPVVRRDVAPALRFLPVVPALRRRVDTAVVLRRGDAPVARFRVVVADLR
ncbi:hypothetical protein [Chondromyces crocatus]|uniref:hypothetical protein n=1 Tax=Chondromyces crocatus TaxID=52 RepID=UPI0012E24F87|nr:hypothetical protein [Chondromyces crocatus]